MLKTARRRWSRALHARSGVRSVAVRLLVLFAAMLVALPLLADRGDKYRCRFSGRVMDACCCRARAAAARASTSAEVRPADCCDTIRSAPGTVAPGVPDAIQVATKDGPESTLALVPEATVSGSTGPVTRLAVQARAGPSIFLRDCRLLT